MCELDEGRDEPIDSASLEAIERFCSQQLSAPVRASMIVKASELAERFNAWWQPRSVTGKK